MYTDYSILTTTFRGRYYYPHYPNEETDTERLRNLPRDTRQQWQSLDDPNSVMSVEKCPHFFSTLYSLNKVMTIIIIVDI